MSFTTLRHKAAAWIGIGAALLCSFAMFGGALAANTQISNAPLFTSSNNAVKPNIMFILDDSGSMANNYLPDEAGFTNTKYGKFASQCNGVAYNPDVIYALPVDATGATAAAGSLSFITFNPTKTTTQRTLSATVAMPTAATGTFTVTVTTASPNSAWYTAGNTLTVFQTGDATRYIVGDVVSWNSTTRKLVLDLTADSGLVVGSGTLTSPKVGFGEPTGSTYYKYTGSQPRLSYTYTSAGVITTTNFYKECNSVVGSSPGSAVFTAVTVTSLSAEAQNYANWYQYYGTRMNMMKSSISLAFKGVDSRYRLGFSTISDSTTVESTATNTFLDVRDYDATQKGKFYSAFNAATPSGWTPLRGALSKAGQYYAKKTPGQTVDPMQYSCQRNFTILSTDGYWNTPDESTTVPKYGPYQLDNITNVGEQDGSGTLRPMLDGNSITSTTTTTWTSTTVSSTTTVTPLTKVTSSSRTTTTFAPVKGFLSYNYTLPTTKRALGSITRPVNTSPYWATVTLSTHGFGAAGTTLTAVVSQTGGTPTFAGYTGTVVISVIDTNTFKFHASPTASTQPGTPTAAINYTVALQSASSCPVGQGPVIQQSRTWDELTSTTATTTSTSTTFSTLTAIATVTDKITFTEVVTRVDGVLSSDITTQGLLHSTPSTTTTTATSPLTTATGVVSASNPNVTTTVVLGGTSTFSACASSLPSPNPSTPTVTATSTTGSTTTTSPVTTGPTTTTGTVVLSTAGPTTTLSSVVTATAATSNGGVSDSLADVAAYYYNTDLRDSSLSNCTGALGSDVCTDNVPGTSSNAQHSFGDNAAWQHMTTFTLGLGVSGLLTYDPKYQTQLSGDFYQITNGLKSWTTPGPTAGPENIDDLWHTAVNGRGQYFSAGDPTSLSASLNAALDSIKAITGAAAAAATSSLQPVQGDNDIFVAQFTSVQWFGDLLAYKIDPSTGVTSNTTTWSARAQLDAKAPSSRVIYYPDRGGSSTLKSFTYANLSADSYGSFFDNFCSKTGADLGAAPQQCASLDSASRTAANSGANLVSYLRGDQSLSYYRSRISVLGDIVSAAPLFVGKPSFKYLENGYPDFQSLNAARTAVVLAGANDGMLHAFDRITGAELWSYIPSFVIPKLYKLADTSYSNNHDYYVDGSPQVADIFVGGHWKTIVVGGLNAGGRGYYALDLTNPAAPKLLWEFSNNNLGLSFGNPIITKRADNSWVVVFSSGYNNVSPGDGNGHMFVLNADTGALVTQIDTFTSGTTPAGTTSAPSGLARLNDWVDSETNNLALRYYGGDLLGNLWRFDLDSFVAPFGKALLLAQLKLSSGTPQSITVKPALAQVRFNNVDYPVVYVGTGRYLGTADLADNSTQTIYAIKDPMTDSSYGDIRSTSQLVTQTLTIGTDGSGRPTRSITSGRVDWSSKAGWRVDLPGSGERVNVNPQVALNVLFVATNLPSNDTCTVGGSSFLYKLDVATGSTASGESSPATFMGNVLIEGMTNMQLGTGGDSGGDSGTGTGSLLTEIVDSEGNLTGNPTSGSSSAGALHRTSWRELVN